MKCTTTKYRSGTLVRLLLFSLSCIFTINLHAQENSMASKDTVKIEPKNEESNFNLHLNLRNMHIWHGSVVTPGAMLATSMEYTSKNDKFTLGLWGGASFNGDYKEFTYYTSYKFVDNFKASVISHNNYSNSEKPDIFSYDKYTSPNFVDIVFDYTVSEKIPLSIYWSTILFGNGQDFEENEDGSVTDSYSNYLELRYRLINKKRTKLSIFTGGAFSYVTEKTFYSEKANIVNVGLTLNQTVKVFSHDLPVSGTAFWNPETKVGALQIDISLF